MVLSLKQTTTFMILLVVLGGTVAWGIKVTVDKLQSAEYAGITKVEASNGSLKLVATVDKAEYLVGEIVDITITLVNIGNSTLELEWRSGGGDALEMFTVYNERDEVAYGPALCNPIALAFTKILKTMEGFDWTTSWALGTSQYSGQPYTEVPPGKYRIVVEMPNPANPWDVTQYINGTEKPLRDIHIKTPALVITISEPSITLFNVEASNESLKLVAMVDKTSYGLGETIKITVLVYNIGCSSIILQEDRPLMTYTLYNEEGNIIYQLCHSSGETSLTTILRKLEPGKYFAWVGTWSQRDDDGKQASPGKYDIVIQMPNPHIYKAHLYSQVKTPALTITIT